MAIKVQAIQKGYYGLLLRIPGTPMAKFHIEEEREFSKKWMIKGWEAIPEEELNRLGRDQTARTKAQVTQAASGSARVSDKSPI